jgi:hypothetical protein
MHTLQGVQALQFLRTRHGVGDGSDLGRISNQQVYLTSLVRKLKSKDILSNPVALYSLAQAAAEHMKLSNTLAEPTTLMAIANALKDIPMKNITFLQLPSVYGLPAPHQGRVKPDYEKAQILFDLMKNDQPLVLGEVVAGMKASDPAVTTKVNQPMMPVVWTKSYTLPGGATGQCLTTTMGASQDLENEALRRLIVNASYRLTGLEVPTKADVALVGAYKPTRFSFNGYTKGVKPADLK